jgi:membrane protease YdiL (CAAX protease family)
VKAVESHDLSVLTELDGSWERAQRNPTAAAFLGLLIVGVIYFNAQAILGGILLIVDTVRTHSSFHGKTFIEQLKHMAMAMKAPMRITVFVSQFLCMLLPTWWIVKRWHSTNVVSYLRFKKISIVEIVLAIAVTACVVPVNKYIGEFFMERLHVPDFLSRINAQVFTSYSYEELLWVLVVVCVTPAICEELLFRGYVQRTLERKLGIKSIFITGIIFGLYHMQPINLLSLSLLGILFGFFFYRSQSVFPSMAAHFTNNLFAVLSLYKTPDDRAALEVYTYQPTFLGVIVALCVAGILLMAYYFSTQKNFEEGIL